jgi:HK97 family phage major capsid protein
MADKNDEIMRELKGVVDTQRKFAEENGFDSPKAKEYREKTDQVLAKFEEINAESVKQYEEQKKSVEEQKERIAHLEKLGSMGIDANISPEQAKEDSKEVLGMMLKGDWVDSISRPDFEKKAQRVFETMAKQTYPVQDKQSVKNMLNIVSQFRTKAATDILRSDIGELGGFLCPPEVSAELNKLIIERGPVRNFARVKKTNSKTYSEWVRVGIPVASRPGEGRAGDKSAPKYAEQSWNPIRMSNTIPMTAEQMLFSAVDMVSEIMQDNAEAFAVKESQEFFNGTGVKEGLGWSVDANVPEKETATTTLDFDDLRLLQGDLKRGYDPLYMFNRRTLAYLMTLKDSGGRYLWNPPYGDAAAGSPATINGVRYSADFIEFDDYDTSGGYPILLADMSRFYQIVDRSDITIIRDEYTEAQEATVNFTMHKYTFGKTKIQEAGVRLLRKA